jgi:hypothetical protein
LHCKARTADADICHKKGRSLLLALLLRRHQIVGPRRRTSSDVESGVSQSITEESMKKTLLALSTAAFLGSTGLALAEDVNGTIQAVDPAARTIQLEDGSIFTVAEGVALEALQPGTEVTVSYEETDGMKTATQVVPAQ